MVFDSCNLGPGYGRFYPPGALELEKILALRNNCRTVKDQRASLEKRLKALESIDDQRFLRYIAEALSSDDDQAVIDAVKLKLEGNSKKSMRRTRRRAKNLVRVKK